MRLISDYRSSYAAGTDFETMMRKVWEKIRDHDDDGIFIHKATWDEILVQIAAIPDGSPLSGVPYAAKDNIDVAGMPTTAACPEFSYMPEVSATVVKLLSEAGAVCFGKTNLDQFATGLVGVRTPYPAPRNPFDEEYLPGGSSCGSAIAVAKCLVPFSLGTDTAGSGRVPAAFNELIGLKPTRGFISTKGVVDACKSLDCVSIFANSCADADEVLRIAGKFDPAEAWSRRPPVKWLRLGGAFRFGMPDPGSMDFHGWDGARDLLESAARRLEVMGGERVAIDLSPFLTAAQLLYEGPWVTERFVGIRDFLKAKPYAIHPVTRRIIEAGESALASDFFTAQYKLAECKRLASQQMDKVDLVLLPTTPRNFTLEEVAAEPVKLNSILGIYTNFMNLLDYSALALPAGRYQGKLPWGVTLFSGGGMDRALLEIGAEYEQLLGRDVPGLFTGDFDGIHVVVCGAHLGGMPLNWQLTGRGGRLVSTGSTAACYRMYLIPAGGGLPERPALVRVPDGEGVAIEVETWALSSAAFGDFVPGIPAPLGIGKIVMDGGCSVSGFIAEPLAARDARDISSFGGWRGYVSRNG